MIEEKRAQLIAQLRTKRAALAASGRDAEWERMTALAQSDAPIFSREQFTPGHFTASGFVLSPQGDELLLILHKKLRLWLQPGGHIEATDPSWLAASQREVTEETGLDGLDLVDELIDIDIHAIPAFGSESAHLHFDLRALYRAHSMEVGAGDGVWQARWFQLRHIIECAGGILRDQVGTDASVVRVAQAALLLGAPNR